MPRSRESSHRHRNRVPSCIGAAALALGHLSNAFATPSRVTIVHTGDADPTISETSTRLAAELRAAGFEVAFVDGTPDVDPTAQVRGATVGASLATIVVVRSERGVVSDVWVADGRAGAMAPRRVDVEAGVGTAPAIVAVRTVELIRAALLDHSPAGATASIASPSSAPAAAPPVAAASPREAPSAAAAIPPARAPRGAAAAVSTASPPAARTDRRSAEPDNRAQGRRLLYDGLAVGLGAEGFSTFGAFAIAPTVRASYGRGRLAVRSAFAGPSSTVGVSAREGSATLRQEMVLVEALYAAGDARAFFVPIVSLGAGVHHVHVSGRADPPYVGREADRWGAVAEATLGFAARITDPIAIVADAGVAFVLPEPVVLIVNNEAARAHEPIATGSIGLLASF